MNKTEIKIEATNIFYRNASSQKQTIINRGGAGSSKSYSLAQLFLSRFLSASNKKFLVIRKSLPSLRVSTLLLFYELLDIWKVRNRIREEKQTLSYRYKDNYLHFASLDDPEKIKSSSWNYIWMEEATEFTYDDYQILRLRLRSPTTKTRNQIYLSFNPIDEFHWIKEKLSKEKDVEEIISTFQDNPFLDKDYVKTLEKLINQDINYYRIYTHGEWGKLEHLIYKNWDVVDSFPDEKMETIYGIDIGFAYSPTVILELGIMGNDIWERELLNQTPLTNADLIEKMKVLIPNKRAIIYADSAEPARIQEIEDNGWLNIHSSNKSILDGIDYVKRLKIHIEKDSTTIIKEKKCYSWRKDKAGNVLPETVKFMDHFQDAVRYA